MGITLLAAQYGALYLLSYTLWKILRRVFVKGGLDQVAGPPSESYLKGVFARVFDPNGWDFHRMMWETYGPVTKLKGLFGEDMLYTYDPKAMHHILVKDQNVFQPAETGIMSIKLIFGNGLLGTVGNKHKRQRKLLNPVFSIAHMRQMVPMFYNISHKLENSLVNQVKNGTKEIDMVFWMGRTALELIGQAGFGHSFDDLSEDYHEHYYSSALKGLIPIGFKLSFFRVYFLKHFMKLGPASFRRTLVNFVPVKAFHQMRDIVDTLHETSLDIYRSKKKALLEGNQEVTEQISKGKDILSILMKQNMEASEDDQLDEEEIYAQISTFTFAGMDTTSNALSRTLWLLAQNKDAQSRLRSELREAMRKAGGDIPYDELVSLPYLDAICRETLRLYSPVNQLMRQPVEDIVLPLSRPITLRSGHTTSEIMVPKGTKCIVSLVASNRNTEIWGPDAHEWKPERWMGEMKEEIVSAKVPGIYSHLMTFGGGGRACIGFKFSQLEMKTVLAILVSRFEFSTSKEVAWQMTGVVVPVLKDGDPTKPTLPLKFLFSLFVQKFKVNDIAICWTRPPSESYFKGVLSRVFDPNGWAYHRMMWDTYGPVIKLKGLFGDDVLYTYDPKAMHHILVKDQNVFQLTDTVLVSMKLIFGNGLLGTLGDKHRRQRKLVNPVFSIAHFRQMTTMFYGITHKLENTLVNQVKNGPKEIDMAFWLGRIALELVVQAGFGHSFDDLSEDYQEHYYSSALKRLAPVAYKLSFFRMYFLKPLSKLGPASFRRKLVGFAPMQALREMGDIVDTLHRASLEIYRTKKHALLEGNEQVAEHISKGKDVLSILMKLNMEAAEEDKLEEEEIYSQISTITFTGMDTTSNGLARTFWVLAQNKDAQSRLRAEIREAMRQAGGDIPYDVLVSLPYMDAICRETLRLYAPVPVVMRQPVEDIMLPLSSPITLTSGRTTSEIMVPKGTQCIVGLLASNRNTELWGPDADEWKPERWMSGEMRKELTTAKVPGIYSHLMTFSGGGRACMGFKFSQLEMSMSLSTLVYLPLPKLTGLEFTEAVLAILISRFEFSPSKEVDWQLTGVICPALKGGDPTKSTLPMMVSLAEPAHITIQRPAIMPLTLLHYVQIAVVSYVAWKIMRRKLVKSPLDDIPGPPSVSALKGVIPLLFDPDGWDYHRKIWETYKGVAKINGGMGGNLLYIYDTKALHHILVKDQATFQLPEMNVLASKLYFGSGLAAVSGDHHKRQRRLLNPPFSAGHLRDMSAYSLL
ncbi:hypothetical protein CVT24_000411 [Panaeolus cyanescens]|uniref:Cytochrome P450 n=1 Tax=Panaeolus cyanescens TaxID=181874 RepID=A0A409YDL8_9AGAR|nr:hypothetical protein CVT24_000411 [Panaeolus cyanescens]